MKKASINPNGHVCLVSQLFHILCSLIVGWTISYIKLCLILVGIWWEQTSSNVFDRFSLTTFTVSEQAVWVV
jgi:hypothetical protein